MVDIVMVVHMAAEMVEMALMVVWDRRWFTVFLSIRLCRWLEKPAMPGENKRSMNKMMMTLMMMMMMMMMRPDWSVKHCSRQPA